MKGMAREHLALSNRRVLCGILVVAALLTTSCLEEQKGILYFNWNTIPPDTVSELTARIEGEVVRSPARTGLITVVIAEGGAATVEDTASGFGVFRLDVPLVANSENLISVSASDNTGAVSPNPRVFVVVHRDPTPFESDLQRPR